MVHNSDDEYRKSFEKFLAHTDEKKVFLKEFNDYIERYNPVSVLDIGAGNGSLSIPLANKVKNYLAVEENHKYAVKLRKAGLDVVENSFPIELDTNYDLVLMSHVVSYEKANYKELISPALNVVSKGGRLLFVTHRGKSVDDWSRLMQSINMDRFEGYSVIYQNIIDLLSEAGKVSVREVITTLETSSIDDMIEAMAFVAANGRADSYYEFISNKKKIIEILDTKYTTATGYSFPFRHIFIETHC